MSKAREWPGVGKCPAPGQYKICKYPIPGTDKAGKCPAVARGGKGGGGGGGGGGGDWARVELTDVLVLVFSCDKRAHFLLGSVQMVQVPLSA